MPCVQEVRLGQLFCLNTITLSGRAHETKQARHTGMTKQSDFFLQRDLTLTRLTAHKRGYAWVLDILTDLPDEILQEFTFLVQENGYKLGKGGEPLNEAIGLYRPIGENEQERTQ